MRFCALCGIHITQGLHEPWLKEFRAVYIEDNNWDNVKLSGVGIRDEFDDVFSGTFPSDPSKRYDDPLDPDSMIDVALMRLNMSHFVPPYPGRYDVEPLWGFCFHSSCWNIFSAGFIPNLQLLFEACLSMPIGMDKIMDWGHDYEGAAILLKNLQIPTRSSRFPDMEDIPKELRSDPSDIPSLAKAINLSARLQNDTFQSRLSFNQLNLEEDSFSALSPELLQSIITLLPTHDVRSLRLASPVFATLNLPERFWASRFEQGNEFDHIPEVCENPPESWRALYLSFQIWAHDNPAMANRRRVRKLAKTLQSTLSQMDGVTCNGSPLETWFEPSAALRPHRGNTEISWYTAARGLEDPDENFSHGCRALRARALYFSQPLEIQSMSVSFILTGAGPFISGLLFIDKDYQHHSIGYLHHNQMSSIQLSNPQRIQGWQLALDFSGIRAIAIITEDGTLSPWAGEPGDLPRWHLAEVEDILSIKAEFDALKLISLSRDSSKQHQWQNNCLWYPDVPANSMLFNGSRGDEPPNQFDHPVTTLFFGESNGQYLSSLNEIVVWIFDEYHIVGMEFQYADASRNNHLGLIGPFDDDHYLPQRYGNCENYRVTMPIDGSNGEELKEIEVQENGCDLVGLKIRTNFDREFTSPQCHFKKQDDWITVKPAGSKVVGLFCTYGLFFWDLGLISTN